MAWEAARLVIAAAALIVIAAVAAASQLQIRDATVRLATDSLIVAKGVEIINGTCPEVVLGPFRSSDCVRQIGAYLVAYLPPGYVVRVREGWVIGLFERVEG
jgi:hypothetical protein